MTDNLNLIDLFKKIRQYDFKHTILSFLKNKFHAIGH